MPVVLAVLGPDGNETKDGRDAFFASSEFSVLLGEANDWSLVTGLRFIAEQEVWCGSIKILFDHFPAGGAVIGTHVRLISVIDHDYLSESSAAALIHGSTVPPGVFPKDCKTW